MDQLAFYVVQSSTMLDLFKAAYNPSHQVRFVEEARMFLTERGIPYPSPELWSDFCAWIQKHPDEHPSLVEAALRCRAGVKQRRALHNRLLTDLNLRRREEVRTERLSRIPIISVRRLSNSYPPAHAAVYETTAIGDAWMADLQHGHQADVRRQRPNPLLLDFDLLQHNVKATEDAIIQDKETGEI
ncbi:MAG: isoleucine--tRNA ligase, partial [Watsoniomyces obsoletus]